MYTPFGRYALTRYTRKRGFDSKALCSDNRELAFGAVSEFTVGEPSPLFARLDLEKVMAEIEAEKEKAAKPKTPKMW